MTITSRNNTCELARAWQWLNGYMQIFVELNKLKHDLGECGVKFSVPETFGNMEYGRDIHWLCLSLIEYFIYDFPSSCYVTLSIV